MTTALGFRSLIENSSDAILLIDFRGEILYASAATSKVFGYEPEELVGRNSLDLLDSEGRIYMSEKLSELLDGPSVSHRWQGRSRRKDGTSSSVESTACNMLGDPDVRAIAVNYRELKAILVT
jgi:PAS domain S-box-containing protein